MLCVGGKILNQPTLAIFINFGQIPVVVSSQIMKNNIAVWSHCRQGSLRRLPKIVLYDLDLLLAVVESMSIADPMKATRVGAYLPDMYFVNYNAKTVLTRKLTLAKLQSPFTHNRRAFISLATVAIFDSLTPHKPSAAQKHQLVFMVQFCSFQLITSFK